MVPPYDHPSYVVRRFVGRGSNGGTPMASAVRGKPAQTIEQYLLPSHRLFVVDCLRQIHLTR